MISRIRSFPIGLFIISTVILLGILPGIAQATPPKDVQLTYNHTDQTLTVAITHYSLMPGFHYIKNVDIKKNGQIISKDTYKSQPGKEYFSYIYKIPAVPDDDFEVTATCSFYGSKTVNIKVK
jgi:hypothetical protein